METEESDQNIQNDHDNMDTEEKKQKNRKVRVNKEKQRNNIIRSGNRFINTFKTLLLESKAHKDVMCHYMERVLHSIFFFGYINCPPISPGEFLPEHQIERFQNIFPKPFSEYNTHLPCYTPFSILLEYMVGNPKPKDLVSFFKNLLLVYDSLLKLDDEKENEITNDFAASVVTYCYVKNSNDSSIVKEAYGSSMSCKGKTIRRIMIAISALHVWDRAIAYAVCCAGNGPPITFPKQVYCNSYNLRVKSKIPPCGKCVKMYVVKFDPQHQAHNKTEDWLYGNCAENESFSRLLQNHEDVRNEVCVRCDNGEKMNREDIENKFKIEYEGKIKKEVRQLLVPRNFKLKQEEWNFFTPSF